MLTYLLCALEPPTSSPTNGIKKVVNNPIEQIFGGNLRNQGSLKYLIKN